MAIDSSKVGSPGWWLNSLMKRLASNRPRYQKLEDYYCGEPDLPIPYDGSLKLAYKRLISLARMNYAELAVEAVRERLNPNGFLLSNGDDSEGAKQLWNIWQSNHMDADWMLSARASLVMGNSYMIVGKNENGPLITCEDPREVITAHEAIDRRKTIAALKIFNDPNYGTPIAYLFLPGVVYRAEGPSQQLNEFQNVSSSWSFVDQQLTLDGIVPVVAFPNNPNIFGRGYGEFEKHLGLLDRINYTILTRLEIATMQAFKQRGITGVPDVDAEGVEIDYKDVFRADPGAMWLLPEGSSIWESGQTDLNGIRTTIRDDVQDFAAVTRTPLFYLTPDANNGSAEGASLAREGLIFKTKDRIRQAAESLEIVASLALRFAGEDARANSLIQTLWDDPERFTLSEKFDAATKALSAQVPWETVMSSVLQYTPPEIAQMQSQRASDALQAASLAAPVQPGPALPPVAPTGAETPPAPAA